MNTPTPGSASELLPQGKLDYDAMYEDPTYILVVRVMQSDAYASGSDYRLREATDNAYASVKARYTAPVTEGAQREAVAPRELFVNAYDTDGQSQSAYQTASAARRHADLSKEYVACRYVRADLVPAEPTEDAPPPPDRVQPERGEAADEGDGPDRPCDCDCHEGRCPICMCEPAPPTDASGGVTEADEAFYERLSKTKFFLAPDDCELAYDGGIGFRDDKSCKDSAQLVRVEAADRARKQTPVATQPDTRRVASGEVTVDWRLLQHAHSALVDLYELVHADNSDYHKVCNAADVMQWLGVILEQGRPPTSAQADAPELTSADFPYPEHEKVIRAQAASADGQQDQPE